MKTILLLAIGTLLTVGCNINPSKEARIQKLETEMGQALEKINQLENRCQTLESANNIIETKLHDLEE